MMIFYWNTLFFVYNFFDWAPKLNTYTGINCSVDYKSKILFDGDFSVFSCIKTYPTADKVGYSVYVFHSRQQFVESYAYVLG